MEKDNTEKTKKRESYWKRRSHLMYYQYLDQMVRVLAKEANSMIDIGSSNIPIIESFDWVPYRYALDLNQPYESNTVKGIKEDFLSHNPQEKYDFALCLQVLEHIPDVHEFALKLFDIAHHVIISVPYKWDPPHRTHVHDPVDFDKLYDWTGRKPTYHIVISELFSKRQRLLCYYHPHKDKLKLKYLREDLKQINS